MDHDGVGRGLLDRNEDTEEVVKRHCIDDVHSTLSDHGGTSG